MENAYYVAHTVVETKPKGADVENGWRWRRIVSFAIWAEVEIENFSEIWEMDQKSAEKLFDEYVDAAKKPNPGYIDKYPLNEIPTFNYLMVKLCMTDKREEAEAKIWEAENCTMIDGPSMFRKLNYYTTSENDKGRVYEIDEETILEIYQTLHHSQNNINILSAGERQEFERELRERGTLDFIR